MKCHRRLSRETNASDSLWNVRRDSRDMPWEPLPDQFEALPITIWLTVKIDKGQFYLPGSEIALDDKYEVSEGTALLLNIFCNAGIW